MHWISRIAGGMLRLRNRHFLAYDICMLCLTPLLALELRTDGQIQWNEYGLSIPLVIAVFLVVKLAVFLPAKLYQRYWRYASVDELAKITLACMIAIAIQTILFLFVLRPAGFISEAFPRSIPLIEGMLALIVVGGGRYAVRMSQRAQQRLQNGTSGERVLIVGAGEAGLMIAREMQSNQHLQLKPIGFVDDDPLKQQLRMRGLQVLGTREGIPDIVSKYRVQLVVIAIPRAPGKEIRDIAAICERVGVKVKVVPGVYELLDGVSVKAMRDIQLEDLLRRPAVKTDTAPVGEMVQGRRVIVTGAGGSIGSELCRQLVRFHPGELILLGHGENSLFLAEADLRRILSHQDEVVNIRPVVADIRDEDRLEQVFSECRPQIIYHAAAHKHVTLMERNEVEAVSNNVVGTRNLLAACERHDVERFVMISTDKAVHPTNMMGATKRIAELLVRDAAHRTGRAFVAVRFGNVLGSRGSVVQIFRHQIAQGGPVTVTDPDAERYFMTIPEAVQLVLQAGAMGSGGEVFVLDMGEPVRIIDLANDMIRLSGLAEGRDIDIILTGLQPGEKLTEELFTEDEHVERTAHDKIMVSRNGLAPSAAWNGHTRMDDAWFSQFESDVEQLIEAARNGRTGEVREWIGRLIPGFSGALMAAEHR